MSITHLNLHLPAYRLIACFHRKAASSSLRDAFLSAAGVKEPGAPFKRVQVRQLWVPPEKVREMRHDDNCRVVTFVRHPEERVRSAWHGSSARRQLRAKNWDDFVRKVAQTPDRKIDKHLRGQLYAMGTEPTPGYGFTLEGTEWRYVQQELHDYCGLELPPLGRFNVSKSHDAPWTDEQRGLIRDRYAADYEAFGYK